MLHKIQKETENLMMMTIPLKKINKKKRKKKKQKKKEKKQIMKVETMMQLKMPIKRAVTKKRKMRRKNKRYKTQSFQRQVHKLILQNSIQNKETKKRNILQKLSLNLKKFN